MKSLKIAKWISFTIVYVYSAINVILFIMALVFGCVNWSSENLVADLLRMLVFLIVAIMWHIDINLSDYYEKRLKDNNKEIDDKYNHIVHLQNRIDENKNFEHLIVNKRVSMFYISLSATYDRYNNYVSEEQKLTEDEFNLIKNIYYEFIEDRS